jgi:hypothetical protein
MWNILLKMEIFLKVSFIFGSQNEGNISGLNLFNGLIIH